MKEALRLAAIAKGRTAPDPMVGALIVKGGEIIASGYHEEVGTPHAEAVAINEAGENTKDSTIYITLEPCCHWGNNPPCTDAIIKAGIKKVIFAMKDPNPLVKKGDSETILKRAGIEVEFGCLEKEARELNEAFIKYITSSTPFVTMKSATTLDGKIATASGDSKWITSPKSRQLVHRMRSESDVVITGIGTVLADNPSLNVRDCGDYELKVTDPARVIVDSNGRIPLDSNVLNLTSKSPTIVALTESAPKEKAKVLEDLGVIVIQTPIKDGHVDLIYLLDELGKRGYMSALLESGGNLNAAFLKENLVDKVVYFVAPKIAGGKDSLTSVEGVGVSQMSDAIQLENVKSTYVDPDIMIEGYIT